MLIMEKTNLPWHILNAIILLNVTICFFNGILVLWLFESYYTKSFYLGEELKHLQYKQENIILRASMEIKEQAYSFISMELHDNIAQVLSLAKLNLNRLYKQEEPEQAQFLEDAKTYLTKSIVDLSEFSKTLDADTILSQGLEKAIEFEIEHYNKHFNNNIHFISNAPTSNLSNNESLIIFRIFQEALNNVIKHADASNVIISIDNTDYELKMTIQDNGKGFDVQQKYESKKDGFRSGLKNMKTRASLIGGTLTLQSDPTKGTTLNLILPLTQNNKS